jgi:N-acylneuraminate cytidylyltransferase
MDKVSVFLPTRSGSERIPNKNTKRFSGIDGGLLELKLMQLINCSSVDEIILSTNDSKSIEIGSKYLSLTDKMEIVERPHELALSTTDLIDLVDYVPQICTFDHILWTHVTSPLVDSFEYQKAINAYFSNIPGNYDSLMSVKIIQNFIWSEELNSVSNKHPEDKRKWPRTQDLNKVYEVNSAIFLASKSVYEIERDRIGRKPYLFVQNDIISTDVDWEYDFDLAEILYEKYRKR